MPSHKGICGNENAKNAKNADKASVHFSTIPEIEYSINNFKSSLNYKFTGVEQILL